MTFMSHGPLGVSVIHSWHHLEHRQFLQDQQLVGAEEPHAAGEKSQSQPFSIQDVGLPENSVQ